MSAIQATLPPAAETGHTKTVLRECRERIAPDRLRLGIILRRIDRIGKRVTQEEVAEAADVSREWYARLEAGRAMRASPVLLDRLAGVLMMDGVERRALFAFAIPELRAAGPDAAFMLAGEITSLRTVMRRLWAATSHEEVVATLLHDMSTRFHELDHAMVTYRVEVGTWDKALLPLRPRNAQAIEEIHRAVRTEYTRPEEEDWNLVGLLTQPGELGFISDLLARSPLAARMGETIARAELGEMSIVAAHLRANDGYEANLTVGYEPRHGSFSASDLAVLGAVAEFASFVLER